MSKNLALKDLLDLDEYDYFYHMTSEENAESICEEGLLVNGTNILDTNNIIYTTAIPIDADVLEEFDYILEDEMGSTNERPTDACVIIGAPKSYNREVVENFDDYHNGDYYEGIVYNSMIMGYFDMKKEFHPNEAYGFVTNIYDDYDDYSVSFNEKKR